MHIPQTQKTKKKVPRISAPRQVTFKLVKMIVHPWAHWWLCFAARARRRPISSILQGMFIVKSCATECWLLNAFCNVCCNDCEPRKCIQVHFVNCVHGSGTAVDSNAVQVCMQCDCALTNLVHWVQLVVCAKCTVFWSTLLNHRHGVLCIGTCSVKLWAPCHRAENCIGAGAQCISLN